MNVFQQIIQKEIFENHGRVNKVNSFDNVYATKTVNTNKKNIKNIITIFFIKKNILNAKQYVSNNQLILY